MLWLKKSYKNENSENVLITKAVLWVKYLAFFIDITCPLNNLNIKLPGKDQLITKLPDLITDFVGKFALFKKHFKKLNFWRILLRENT